MYPPSTITITNYCIFLTSKKSLNKSDVICPASWYATNSSSSLFIFLDNFGIPIANFSKASIKCFVY